MKDIARVRLENLELLVKEFGTLEAVAARGETTSVYLSQLRNSTPDSETGRPRGMGTVMARRLEAGCKKPSGWMDQDHGQDHIHLSEQELDLIRLFRGFAEGAERGKLIGYAAAMAEAASRQQSAQPPLGAPPARSAAGLRLATETPTDERDKPLEFRRRATDQKSGNTNDRNKDHTTRRP